MKHLRHLPQNDNNFNALQNLRLFRCEYENCGKSFVKKYVLKRHEVRHSDRYLCDFIGCGYRGSGNKDLNNHKKKHLKHSYIENDTNFNPIVGDNSHYFNDFQTLISINNTNETNDNPNNEMNAENNDLNQTNDNQIYITSDEELSDESYVFKCYDNTNEGAIDSNINIQYKCDFKGCSESFTTERRLRRHQKCSHSLKYKCLSLRLRIHWCG